METQTVEQPIMKVGSQVTSVHFLVISIMFLSIVNIVCISKEKN